ncbi:Salutaridine reductase [Platanthera zijinensis]|uniref:Salutaridine reductase n=1 Tax=Platanthera zijinensis TaxID=2320716 RepID=A0AAP0GG69_9ASPA
MGSIVAEQQPTTNLCAVVTGANKGIGLAVVRQLAELGVTVVLTARDVSRGTAAARSLHSSGLSNILFHQLDVSDPISAASLAGFLSDRFGRLDILVNNAAASGVVVSVERLAALNIDADGFLSGKTTNLVKQVMEHTHESAVACIEINYFGCKRVTEALLPLLRLSPSGARIVNVSSTNSELKQNKTEGIREELADGAKLDEERIEKILGRFLEDSKEGKLEAGGWPTMLPAYSISKMAVNAYTRGPRGTCEERIEKILGRFRIKGGKVNWNTGVETADEGARGPVMLALLPAGGPSGRYFRKTAAMADF